MTGIRTVLPADCCLLTCGVHHNLIHMVSALGRRGRRSPEKACRTSGDVYVCPEVDWRFRYGELRYEVRETPGEVRCGVRAY